MLTSSFCSQCPRFLVRKNLAWNYRIESLISTRMTLIYFFSLAVLFFSSKIHQTSDQRIWTQFQGKHYLEFDVHGEKTTIFLHQPLSHVVPRILYEVSSPSVVTFNPTLNLFAISVKVFHSLANDFSMLMIPLNYFSFFFSEQNFLVVAILIEISLFAFRQKVKQHSAQAAMEHSFYWTFANNRFFWKPYKPFFQKVTICVGQLKSRIKGQ